MVWQTVSGLVLSIPAFLSGVQAANSRNVTQMRLISDFGDKQAKLRTELQAGTKSRYFCSRFQASHVGLGFNGLGLRGFGVWNLGFRGLKVTKVTGLNLKGLGLGFRGESRV